MRQTIVTEGPSQLMTLPNEALRNALPLVFTIRVDTDLEGVLKAVV